MNKRTSAITVFVILCGVCLAHAFYYYPLLPERIATHFGPSGKPDAWGSKAGFFIVYFVCMGVMAVTFLGLAFSLAKVPDWAVNLPNKEYWLAPERRRQTLDYIESWLLWFGSLTLILLFDIMHQSFQVHLGKATRLEHVWITLGLYILLTLFFSLVMINRFRKA